MHSDTGGYPVRQKQAPEALDVALGQGVADGIDRIESEFAIAVLVDTTEHVVVQAANGMHFKSEASG